MNLAPTRATKTLGTHRYEPSWPCAGDGNTVNSSDRPTCRQSHRWLLRRPDCVRRPDIIVLVSSATEGYHKLTLLSVHSDTYIYDELGRTVSQDEWILGGGGEGIRFAKLGIFRPRPKNPLNRGCIPNTSALGKRVKKLSILHEEFARKRNIFALNPSFSLVQTNNKRIIN